MKRLLSRRIVSVLLVFVLITSNFPLAMADETVINTENTQEISEQSLPETPLADNVSTNEEKKAVEEKSKEEASSAVSSQTTVDTSAVVSSEQNEKKEEKPSSQAEQAPVEKNAEADSNHVQEKEKKNQDEKQSLVEKTVNSTPNQADEEKTALIVNEKEDSPQQEKENASLNDGKAKKQENQDQEAQSKEEKISVPSSVSEKDAEEKEGQQIDETSKTDETISDTQNTNENKPLSEQMTDETNDLYSSNKEDEVNEAGDDSKKEQKKDDSSKNEDAEEKNEITDENKVTENEAEQSEKDLANPSQEQLNENDDEEKQADDPQQEEKDQKNVNDDDLDNGLEDSPAIEMKGMMKNAEDEPQMLARSLLFEKSGPETLTITFGETVEGNDVRVSWNSITQAEHYEYSVRDVTTNRIVGGIEHLETKKLYFYIPGEYIKGGHQYKVWVGAKYEVAVDGMPEGFGYFTAQEKLPDPTITSPSSNEHISGSSFSLSWNAVTGADHYLYSFRNLDTNSSIVSNKRTNGCSVELNLQEGNHKYRAAVGAVPPGASDSSSLVSWSEVEFTGERLSVAETLTITISEAVEGNDVHVSWNSITQAEHYEYSVRDMTTDKIVGGIENFETQKLSFDIPGQYIYANHQYKVWVGSKYAVAVDGMPEGFGYFTAQEKLPDPTITRPSPNEHISGFNFYLSWNEVTGADHYLYSFRNLDTNSSIVSNKRTNGCSVELNLQEGNHKYRAAVGAVPPGASDSSSLVSWSEVEFTGERPIKLDSPVLTSPNDGQIFQSEQVTLSWKAVDHADKYYYGVVDKSDDLILNEFVGYTEKTSVSFRLTPGHSYWAYVVAESEAENYYESDSSDTVSFSIASNAAQTASISITSPHSLYMTDNFTWTPVEGAVQYQYKLFADGGFYDPGTTTEPKVRVSTVVHNDYNKGAGYTFQVCAILEDGTVTQPDSADFFILLPAPVITSPTANQVLDNTSFTFSWNKVAPAYDYFYRVYDLSDNSKEVIPINDTSKTSVQLTLPEKGHTYRAVVGSVPNSNFWYEDTDAVSWSSVEFSVKGDANSLAAPVITAPAEGAVLNTTTVSFQWNNVEDADGFAISMFDVTQNQSILDCALIGKRTNYEMELNKGHQYTASIGAVPKDAGGDNTKYSWSTVNFSVQDAQKPTVTITSINSPVKEGEYPSCTISASGIAYVRVNVEQNGYPIQKQGYSKTLKVTSSSSNVSFKELTGLEPGTYAIAVYGYSTQEEAQSNSPGYLATDFKNFVKEKKQESFVAFIGTPTLEATGKTVNGKPQYKVTAVTDGRITRLSAVNNIGTSLKETWTKTNNPDGTITWVRVYGADVAAADRTWTLTAWVNGQAVGKATTNGVSVTIAECEHIFGAKQYKAAHPHQYYQVCEKCGAVKLLSNQYYTVTTNGTVQDKSVCCVCHGHQYGEVYEENGSWYQKCINCGKILATQNTAIEQQEDSFDCEHEEYVTRYSTHPHYYSADICKKCKAVISPYGVFEDSNYTWKYDGMSGNEWSMYYPNGSELSTCDQCFPQHRIDNNHLKDMAILSYAAYQTGEIVDKAIKYMDEDGTNSVKIRNTYYYDMNISEKNNEHITVSKTGSKGIYSVGNGLRITEESGYPDSYINVSNTVDGKLILTISFEGTQGFGDLLFTDAATKMNSDGVHSGFADIAKEYIRGIFNGEFFINCTIDGVKKDYHLSEVLGKIGADDSAHIRITGHSMGGAAAQCLAYYLVKGDLYKVDKKQIEVYTYASPIPFSYESLESEEFRNMNVYNFINVNDFVPDVGVSMSSLIVTRLAEEGGAIVINGVTAKVKTQDYNGGKSIAGTNMGTNIYVNSKHLTDWKKEGIFGDHDMAKTYLKLVGEYIDGTIPSYDLDTDLLYSKGNLKDKKNLKTLVNIGEGIVKIIDAAKTTYEAGTKGFEYLYRFGLINEQ